MITRTKCLLLRLSKEKCKRSNHNNTPSSALGRPCQTVDYQPFPASINKKRQKDRRADRQTDMWNCYPLKQPPFPFTPPAELPHGITPRDIFPALEFMFVLICPSFFRLTSSCLCFLWMAAK